MTIAQTQMETKSFGARLRAQREQQRITLAVIAGQTKIKEPLLEGLERDDISRWPEGIFRRAYVRAYAKAVGLDADATVREFFEVYPEPVQPPPDEGRPPNRLRYLLGRLRGADASEPKPPPDRPSEPGHERQLADLAALCTRLGRVVAQSEIAAALQEMASALHAVGVIVWVWDSRRKAWVSALSHGYPESTLAQLPAVTSDADNAIGAAFRSGETQVVSASDGATGAVVAPLMTPNGCAGMLAIELPEGRERRPAVRAFVTIVAAQLATLISIPAAASGSVASQAPKTSGAAACSGASPA
jgi:transcriptional regulator with XRE-family HTH domain